MVALALVPEGNDEFEVDALLVEQIRRGFRFTELVEAPLDSAGVDAMGALLAQMVIANDKLKGVVAAP